MNEKQARKQTNKQTTTNTKTQCGERQFEQQVWSAPRSTNSDVVKLSVWKPRCGQVESKFSIPMCLQNIQNININIRVKFCSAPSPPEDFQMR